MTCAEITHRSECRSLSLHCTRNYFRQRRYAALVCTHPTGGTGPRRFPDPDRERSPAPRPWAADVRPSTSRSQPAPGSPWCPTRDGRQSPRRKRLGDVERHPEICLSEQKRHPIFIIKLELHCNVVITLVVRALIRL